MLRNKQSCYITKLNQFISNKDLKEGDVVWFKKAGAANKALCGVWKEGSQEAKSFTAVLRSKQPHKQSRNKASY